MAQERGIKTIEIGTTFDFSAGTITSGTDITANVLLDSTEIGTPQEYATEMADNLTRLDGIKLAGVIRYEKGATGIPADNTAFAIIVTPYSGSAKMYGGTSGFIGRNLPTGIKALSSGRSYNDLVFEAVGASLAELEKDAA